MPDAVGRGLAGDLLGHRKAFAAMVRAGLMTGRDGKNEESTTYRLSTS